MIKSLKKFYNKINPLIFYISLCRNEVQIPFLGQENIKKLKKKNQVIFEGENSKHE